MRMISTTMIVAAALAVASVSPARAACGIGSQIWEGNDGWIPWLAASVTNFWTMKGISTTLEIVGCTEDDNLLKKAFGYAQDNMDGLAVDMSRGEGEHVEALAHLLEVGEEDRRYFGTFLQANLEALLSHDRVSAGELLATLGQLMAADETLSRYVEG